MLCVLRHCQCYHVFLIVLYLFSRLYVINLLLQVQRLKYSPVPLWISLGVYPSPGVFQNARQ